MDIRLYIAGRLVEFDKDIDIYYNFTETDISNPLVIKNSFTKTITVPGTQNNDAIFGHIWKLDRLQQYNGLEGGVYFNPSYRVPFILYIGSNIYQRGYVKLQKINSTLGDHSYEIGLFGGIFSFLYNLATNWETGESKTFADMKFSLPGGQEADLDIVIDKETVRSAWVGNGSKYDIINFAPTNSGLPDNFDAGKAIMNFHGLSGFTGTSGSYTTYEGWALASLPDSLTGEEVKDFRSYLQTPVLRVKSIFDAICDRENNRGDMDTGYDVELDEDWFNENNPYYYDTWMTLPNINTIKFAEDNSVDPRGPISYSYTRIYKANKYQYNNSSITYTIPVSSADLGYNKKIKISFKLAVEAPGVPASATTLHLVNSHLIYNRGYSYINSINAWGVQAYASTLRPGSAGNTVLSASPTAWLWEVPSDGWNFTYERAISKKRYTPEIDMGYIDFKNGVFRRTTGNTFVYDHEIELNCDLREGTNYINIDIQRCDYFGPSTNNYLYWEWDSRSNVAFEYSFPVTSPKPFQDSLCSVVTSSPTSFITGKKISKKELLNLDFTPGDWLVSYCKTFGLYLYQDVDTNTVHIMPRGKYYLRNEVKNIEGDIDRAKEISINPLYMDHGYYTMTAPLEKSKLSEDYKTTYDVDYGCKVIKTGYEFEMNKKELVDTKFQGVVCGNDNGIYYFQPNSQGVHPYMYNGVTYNLYKNGSYLDDTTEMTIGKLQFLTNFYPYIQGQTYTDALPLPCFMGTDKKALKTPGVLLFKTGNMTIPSGYNFNLTDDVTAMTNLNDKPCWIMTTSEYDNYNTRISYKLTSIPIYSRYLLDNGVITYSLDFGDPRNIYIPGVQNNSDACVYHRFFEDYFTDLYDVNTKVVTAYVRGSFNQDSLRCFYYFDNTLWRINKIIDHIPGGEGTTKIEFIKVQDLSSYSRLPEPKVRAIDIEFSADPAIQSYINLSPTSLTLTYGETSGITATTNSPAGIVWSTENNSIAPVSGGQVYGNNSGSTTITASVPASGDYTSAIATCAVVVNPITTTVSISGGSTVGVGDSIHLTCTTNSDVTPVWSSSDSGVATVSSSGVVSGISEGNATITVTIPAWSGRYTSASTSVSVSVTNTFVPVSGISLNKASTTITYGQGETLTATVTPGNATDPTVTWTSTNTSVATVSGGVVSALSSGTTVISATAGNETASCTVSVVPITSTVSISPSATAVTIGNNITLTATTNSTATISWGSSDTTIATVSGGVVTPVSPGSVTITASVPAITGQRTAASASATITVKGTPIIRSINMR